MQSSDLSGVNYINLASQDDCSLQIQLEITSTGYPCVEYLVQNSETDLDISDLDIAIYSYNKLVEYPISSSDLAGIYRLTLVMDTKAILYFKLEIFITGKVDISYVATELNAVCSFSDLEEALAKYNTLSEA